MARDRISDQMKERWDERAARDAFHFVETSHWSGDVDAFFEVGERRVRGLIDPVLDDHLPADRRSRAVELGSGVGRFVRALATRFDEVIGVDVSEEMVCRARSLHPEEAYPGVRFLTSDGLSLPVETESADLVLSYEVFQHMPSRDVIAANLRDARRVLRPDGVALIHVRTTQSTLKRRVPASLRRIKARLTGVDPLKRDSTFLGTPLARGELPKLFGDAGLAVQELRDDPSHDPGERVFVVALVAR